MHSVPQNEALIPRTLLLWFWKTQQNRNRFQNEIPSCKERELYHFLLHCFTCKLAKIQWLVKEISVAVFKHRIIYILFMEDDSGHKVDDLDDGWVLDSE